MPIVVVVDVVVVVVGLGDACARAVRVMTEVTSGASAIAMPAVLNRHSSRRRDTDG